MERIVIIGLGRLGASMGLALKRWLSDPEGGTGRRDRIEIVGFDYDLKRQQRAEKSGSVDRTQWSLPKAVEGAALVIVALPTVATRAVMQELGPLLEDGSILTDTGTRKQESLSWATQFLPSHVSYVSGHPVLSTAEDETPTADLFTGLTYALFPHPNAREESVELVVGLISAIGAKPYFADPAEHDAQMTASMLLPALSAVALMHTASVGAGWRDLKGMATSDLVDSTRLASQDPAELTEAINLSAGDAVRWLDTYIARLQELRDLAARGDREATERLTQFLTDARTAREQWMHPVPQSGLPEMTLGSEVNRFFFGLRRRPKG